MWAFPSKLAISVGSSAGLPERCLDLSVFLYTWPLSHLIKGGLQSNGLPTMT
jgi:hypothetical protein